MEKPRLNQSETPVPQYDISLLYETRERAIKDLEKPTLNEYQRKAIEWARNWCDDKIIQISGIDYLTTYELPSELEGMIYTHPKQKAQDKWRQCDFKIEEWKDLTIKIFLHDVHFLKNGTTKVNEFSIKELKWKGLKLSILKDLAVGSYKGRGQSINNALSDLNKQISYMVGMDIHPIETMGHGKKLYRVSNVKIKLYDADELVMKTERKRNSIHFAKEHNDEYQADANQNRMREDNDEGIY